MGRQDVIYSLGYLREKATNVDVNEMDRLSDLLEPILNIKTTIADAEKCHEIREVFLGIWDKNTSNDIGHWQAFNTIRDYLVSLRIIY